MALKTYILVSDFTFQSDGPIRIGNIIADPFCPTKILSTPANCPPTTTHTDFDCFFSQNSNKSLQGSIWAQFLQNAIANISHRVSKDVSSEYTIDSLDTIRVKEGSLNDEVMERIKEPRVQAAIKSGLNGTAPVYMITGLKVATGFRLVKKITTSTQKIGIDMGLPAAAGVGIGTNISASCSKRTSESFKSGNDIIFAYQLHILARKGWWHKRMEVDIYAPKSAFLTIDAVSLEKEETVTVKLCQYPELLEVAEENEYPPPEMLTVSDHEGGCNCIVFRE
ncbi:hypothetical protein V8C35DRAFT_333242 [Trichoderma chlorosporum]